MKLTRSHFLDALGLCAFALLLYVLAVLFLGA
jgi:hypothetical protein